MHVLVPALLEPPVDALLHVRLRIGAAERLHEQIRAQLCDVPGVPEPAAWQGEVVDMPKPAQQLAVR